MLLDARTLPPRHRLEADLCIVGAGAAGVTLARELGRHGVHVALLESGGLETEPETHELCDGEGTTPTAPDAASYLKSSRVRVFGGTTSHWNGQCRPLDPIDFEPRPWLPESGWPFGLSTLEPYYRRAEPLLDLDPFVAPHGSATTRESGSLLRPDSGLETANFHFSRPTRFGLEFRDEIVRAPRIDLVLHANVLRLECDADQRRVERATAATLEGGRLEVLAHRFVLAAGGIENPRLLLLSGSSDRGGLGNRHDLVGRYFMEHPHVQIGHVAAAGRMTGLNSVLGYRARTKPMLRLVEPVQRQDELLNCAFRFDNAPAPDSEAHVESASRLAADIASLRGSRNAPRRIPTAVFEVTAMTEQAPDPESRVQLGEERDALGSRKAKLTWRLSDLDFDGLRRSCDRLGRELGGQGAVRLRYEDRRERLVERVLGGNHHMGTTRMHSDPRRGVVDADCRVHGLENLYVAGSSVFPTGGWANPTLTILALSFRLADHLAAR